MSKYMIPSILENLLWSAGLGDRIKRGPPSDAETGFNESCASTRHGQPFSPQFSPAGNILRLKFDLILSYYWLAFVCFWFNSKLTTWIMSKKSGARVIALVWSCCWTIQVITGTPVGTPEMDRAFGAPLTAAELACIPTFGKSGS
jgi:hypothetical protein